MRAFRPLIPRLLAAFCLLLAPALAQAQCVGANLFDALPAARQSALHRAAEAVPYPRGLLFTATRGTDRITLVGTYHLPDPRHADTLAALDLVLNDAGTLLVEATPEDEAALQKRLMTDPDLMFSTGPTLPDQLPEADWQALSAEMAARGLPAFLVAKMNPFFAAITLAIPPCATRALAAGQGGLDKQLIDAARARDLPVAALESPDTIFDLFAQISREDGIDMIRAALISARQGDDAAVTMADLYFAAEPRLIWEWSRQLALDGGMDPAEVDHQMQMSEELMMNARNRAWIPVIEAALQAGQGPLVVASGALHLSGEAGLLALLAARGFTIAPLQR